MENTGKLLFRNHFSRSQSTSVVEVLNTCKFTSFPQLTFVFASTMEAPEWIANYGLFTPPGSPSYVHRRLSGKNCNKLTFAYLRNRKRFPCFHKVMVTRVEVWENEKSCGNTSLISTAVRVLPNFHECNHNFLGTRKERFLFLLWNKRSEIFSVSTELAFNQSALA